MKAKKEKTSKKAFFKAFGEAEKKFRDEQVQVLAVEIRKVMVAAKDATDRILKAQEELKVLRQDLQDLKAGRIDKIKARQEKDDLAKKYSKLDLRQIEPMMHYLNTDRVTVIENSNIFNPTLTGVGSIPANGSVFVSALNLAKSSSDLTQ